MTKRLKRILAQQRKIKPLLQQVFKTCVPSPGGNVPSHENGENFYRLTLFPSSKQTQDINIWCIFWITHVKPS